MKLEGCVPVTQLLGEFAGAGQHVTIEREKFGLGDLVAGRREAVQIAEQEAEGVAQLAIDIGAALEQVFAGDHVLAEVDRGDPEADDLAAQAVGDIDGIDAVAEGFRNARPCSSRVKPAVATWEYGARPRRATEVSSEEWNQPRCWSPPSR